MSIDFFDTRQQNWRARVTVSVELMRELSRYTDPDELYRVFARRMQQLYPTSRQLVISRRDFSAPTFRIMRSNQWTTLINPFREPHRLPVRSGGLLADLLYSDQPQIIDELMIPEDDPAAEYLDGQGSLLAIPLYEQGSALSMVILGREEPGAFPYEQIPELIWLINLFGRAAEGLVLAQQVQKLYDSAEYELNTIAEMQQRLVPIAMPKYPAINFAVHYRSAQRTGGDYYDFFPISKNRIGVLIADVSGHGTPAAVLMAITHNLAHARPDFHNQPAEFFAYLNQQLSGNYISGSGYFVTALYCIIDMEDHSIEFVNAGHTLPRFRTDHEGEFHPVEQHRRLPLGVTMFPQAPFPTCRIDFPPGATLALYTDGISESLNSRGEYLGTERLDEILNHGFGSAQDQLSTVIREIDEFSPEVADDQTLLLIQHAESQFQSEPCHCCEINLSEI